MACRSCLWESLWRWAFTTPLLYAAQNCWLRFLMRARGSWGLMLHYASSVFYSVVVRRSLFMPAFQGYSPRIARFGVFELDLAAGELRKKGAKVRLQEQPFQVLAL